MPNKRSRRQVNHFFCPHCQQRLWRMGSTKYYLHYQSVTDIQQYFKTTRKKATLIANQNSVAVDRDRWIEEFFCSEDSTVWLLISRQADGKLNQSIAKENDWQKTGKTFNPQMPNPSISEYSFRMSRSSSSQNKYYRSQI